jgi:hypothetical protein
MAILAHQRSCLTDDRSPGCHIGRREVARTFDEDADLSVLRLEYEVRR